MLPGHAPFLTTLGIGELMYRIGRDEHHVAVAGGFAEVRNDKVIILADSAEPPADIDRARAEKALERAERAWAAAAARRTSTSTGRVRPPPGRLPASPWPAGTDRIHARRHPTAAGNRSPG